MKLLPSEKIVDFIKARETFKPKASRLLASDPWVIGYGFTFVSGYPVRRGDSITEHEADKLLREILFDRFPIVLNPVSTNVTQNQFDAIVSLTYDIGKFSMLNTEMLHLFQLGKDVSGMFKLYAKKDGRIDKKGAERRDAERRIYVSGEY